jgi:hypothetical protein
MNFLCHPNIWLFFNESVEKLTNSNEELLLINLMKNSANNFVYNSDIQGFYNKELGKIDSERYDLDDVFSNFLLELQAVDRLVSEDNTTAIDCDDDLLDSFIKSIKTNFLLVKKEEAVKKNPSKKGVAIFDNINKPNRHWIYYSVLACNGRSTATVMFSDFNKDDEISEFIENLLIMKNPLSRKPHIQTDYMNFGNIFKNLRGKHIIYCTSKYNGHTLKSAATLTNDKDRVKAYFGTNSSFKVSQDKSILHPRTIIYNNMVITLNHDFDQIKVENKNWNITITCCKDTYGKLVQITGQYHPL